MAKIVLNIEVDDPDELQAVLRSLAGASAPPTASVPDTTEVSKPRGRPRKDAANSDTVDAGSGKQTSVPDEAGSDGSGPNATNGASLSEQIARAAAEVEAEETNGAITREMVMEKMKAHMGKHGAPKTQATLEAATGFKRISEVPEDKLAEAYATLDAEI